MAYKSYYSGHNGINGNIKEKDSGINYYDYFNSQSSSQSHTKDEMTGRETKENTKWIKPVYINPDFLIEKEYKRGDRRRLHAKTHAKVYLDEPTMWNHRYFNNNFYSDMWNHQTQRDFNYFVNDSQLYNFIFGEGMETNINFFLNNIVFGKFIAKDGRTLYYVDNIAIDYHGYSTVKKNYTLTFYRGGKLGTQHPSNIVEKLSIAKLIILIMNECDPEEINYTNYGNLIHWILENGKNIEGINVNVFGPIEIVDSKSFNDDKV